MNITRKTSLLSITISAILLTGLIAPSLPQAFAGATCLPFNDVTAQDDLCAPSFGINAPNSVFRNWIDAGLDGDGTPTCAEATGTLQPTNQDPEISNIVKNPKEKLRK